MTTHTKHLLYKLVSAAVPLVSSLSFGALGLAISGLVIGAVGYVMWKDPESDRALKIKALENLFGYATLGSVLGGLWLCLV